MKYTSQTVYIKLIVLLLINQEEWPLCHPKEVPEACGAQGVCHCEYSHSDGLYVNCYRRNLTNIPSNIPGRASSLNLVGNPLRSVAASDLQGLSNLTVLYLGSCSLNAVPEDLLSFVPNLQEIDLSYNNITEIGLPSTLFNPTSLLENIDLSDNLISNIPDQLFGNLRMLRILYLNNNNLHSFPYGLVASAEKLVTFVASGNKIMKLSPDIFVSNTLLSSVSFDNNNITFLPESIFNATIHLRRLNIRLNFYGFPLSVNCSPDIFVSNTLLSSVYLAENNLSILSDRLFATTPTLETLDLAYNNIKELPDGIFHSVKKLTQLLLHDNQITHLSAQVFSSLKKLKTLSLFNNKIGTIADGVFTNHVIQAIFLFDNMLRHVSIDSFQSETISEIHLYGNTITHLSRNSTQKVAPNTTLYLNCEFLHEVQRLHVKVTCVNPMYVPNFTIHGLTISKFMKKEGFTCVKGPGSPPAPPKQICSPCPRGTYANGQNACLHCPKGGFYQDMIGIQSSATDEIACQKCQNGTFVNDGGGASIADCVVCPKGTNQRIHAGFRACFCSDGYARMDRFGPCYACLQEGLNCSGKDHQSLYPGYYWNWTFPGANISQYLQFVDNLRTMSMYYDNHTSYNLEIPRVHKCPNPASCSNNFKEYGSVLGKCAPGYTSWTCRKCERSFYSAMNSCFPCPNMFYLLSQIFFLMCLCAVIFYFMCRPFRRKGDISITYRGFTSVFVSRAKIMLGFYQNVGEFWGSLHGVNWRGNLQIFTDFINLIELNVMKILVRSQCFHVKLVMNPKTEFTVVVGGLFTLTVGPFVIYNIYKLLNKYGNSQPNFRKIKGNLLAFVIVALFVGYPQICKSIFQLYPLACQTYCLDIKNKHCFKVLRSDVDMKCNQLTVYQVAAYVVTAGYVFAYPLGILYLLKRHCSRKTNPESMQAPHKTDYDNVFPYGLDFLHDNFKPEYYYWEVVELSRKLTQTVVVAMLGWDNNFSILFTIGISVLFLVLHARHLPMKDATDQKLQVLSLSVILINVVLVTVDDSPSKYLWILIVLNISVIAIIIADAVVGIFLQMKHILRHRKKLL